MTLSTISDLPLIAALKTPISNAVKQYFADEVAKGSGPRGTFRTVDFFASISGEPATTELTKVVGILQLRSSTLGSLLAIYVVMKNVVTGVYGDPVSGPVTIPPGEPGEGVYSNAEAAFQTLLPIATTALAATRSALGSDGTSLNNSFDTIAAAYVTEAETQKNAGINFDQLQENSQISIFAFAASLHVYGQSTAPGQAADVLSNIADRASETGQAIIGALREGSNNRQIDSAGVNRYNTIPTPN
jgi:hypothetical protein